MSPVDTNITRAEADARGRLLRVHSYLIEADLRSAVDEPGPLDETRTFHTRTTVTVDCLEPGSSTWIDLIATEVLDVQLNGRTLPTDGYDGARLQLPGLAAHNELVVEARCAYSTSGEGLHRAVDPADGEVYLYTQFATAEARRVFACFEQPDLKATFAWQVVGPASWTMLSTSPTQAPVPMDAGLARWTFESTPRLPTYLAVLCAGHFHSVFDEATSSDGRAIPLGVHVRRSMAGHLDAAEILAITRAGLAHYESMFTIPYPFRAYGQVFVPEFNLGAMENPGAVTFNEDHFVFRTAVTEAAREQRAVVILHEMAHMWFGDLVTMRWWDDVWLNESFAEWAGTAVAADATRFTGTWTTFAQARKAWAYRSDQLPSTHPISADMVDLEAVYANFDGITYAKGASVLRQLVAFVGWEAFRSGLAEHLRAHAWGSATLADLLEALSRTSGRDLRPWSTVWLELPGVTSVGCVAVVGPDGAYQELTLLQQPAVRPAGVPEALRPHRIAVGVYRRDAAGALIRAARAEVDLLGATAAVPSLVGVQAGDLLLANDDDLTYIKVRLDRQGLATALAYDGVGALADSLPRALVWGALWEHVRDADLAAQRFVEAALVNLESEPVPRLIETVLGQVRQALDRFVDPALRADLSARVCAATAVLLDSADPGSDRQRSLARAHVDLAIRPQALDRLDALRTGTAQLPGLPLDADLAWAVVVRLAALGRLTDTAIDAQAVVDRTSKGLQAAARARAACPTAEAKSAAWEIVAHPGSAPNAVLDGLIAGFSDPSAPLALMEPFLDRYAAEVPAAFLAAPPMQARAIARGLFPPVCAGAVTVADSLLARPGLPSGLRRVVDEARSEVALALCCRERSARDAVRTDLVAG